MSQWSPFTIAHSTRALLFKTARLVTSLVPLVLVTVSSREQPRYVAYFFLSLFHLASVYLTRPDRLRYIPLRRRLRHPRCQVAILQDRP